MDAVSSVGMMGTYASMATIDVSTPTAAANTQAMPAAQATASSPSTTSISARITSLLQSPEAVSNSDMLNALLLLVAMKLLDSEDKKEEDKQLLAGLLILAAASRQQQGGVVSFQSQSLSITKGSVYLDGTVGQTTQVSLGQAAYSAFSAGGSIAAASGIDISA